MSPRAGDSHQVGGKFSKNHFDLVRVGCGIWAFTLLAETVSNIVLGLDVLGKGHGLV
jgi:hypothetical protein